MNQPRFQTRVGLFAVFCLVLMGALLLAFSRGTGLFAPTYEIRMRMRNVGGLKERSAVFLAGIQVGHLKSVELAEGGRSVVLRLRILKKYPIHCDADFVVEQVGVLGDQFVSIYPTTNAAPLLVNGDEVQGRESLNLQEMAQSAEDLMKQLSLTLGEVRQGVTNVIRGVLDPATLSNLAATVVNLRKASEHTLKVVENVSAVIATNAEPVAQSVSNIVRLSGRLDQAASHLDEVILTNRASLHATLTNFQAAGAALNDIVQGVDAGQGLAGSLLRDTQLQAHLALSFSNLSLLTSNLNRYGLLYKPKPEKRRDAPTSLYPGKRF